MEINFQFIAPNLEGYYFNIALARRWEVPPDSTLGL